MTDETYSGEFENGEMTGLGQLTNTDLKEVWKGTFVSGKKHGQGRVENLRGELLYTGFWEMGALVEDREAEEEDADESDDDNQTQNDGLDSCISSPTSPTGLSPVGSALTTQVPLLASVVEDSTRAEQNFADLETSVLLEKSVKID